MPEFAYTALDQEGKTLSGSITADSRPQAILALAQQGRFVADLDRAPDGHRGAAAARRWWAWRPGPRRVGVRLKAALFGELATALSAGLPLLPALRIVQEQASHPSLRQLAGQLADGVQAGDSLSDVFARQPQVFSPLEVSMIRVGETAGVLDDVMNSLAEFAQRDVEFREKIRAATTYPLFVLGLATISVLIILIFILPRIVEVIGDSPELLPMPTRILITASYLVTHWGWLALLLGGLGYWRFAKWLRTPSGRLTWDGFLLRWPVLGTALRRVAVARFARTLGTLTHAGIGIIESMRVMRDTLGNEALAHQIDQVTAGITQGQSIAEPLRLTGQFPPLLIQVIALGERTGRLDELLLKSADAYEKETTAAVQRVMNILPAVLIVCLALLVAFILAAVLLPVVGMEMSPPGG
jgi:type II secretory pathway component PulF